MKTNIRYHSLAWLAVAAALAYLCRNAVGVAESTIREDLGLTLKQSGWFMGAFFWTYAIFQVPSGWLAQNRGTRVALTAFAIAWSVATLAIAGAPGFWFLIAAQLIMGTAQAGIFPASVQSVGHWMPLAQRSFACGILAAGMQVGAIAASGLTGNLMGPLGWRWVFALFAVPGIFWAAGFLLRFRNRPEDSSAVSPEELALIHTGREETEAEAKSHATGASLWKAVARNPVIWLLCGQQICRAAGYMFYASWFPTFLQETRGVSVKDSGYLQGLVLAGSLTGGICGGILADWVWRRTKSLRISRSGVAGSVLFTCGMLILAAWFVKSVGMAVALLALGALISALAGPCAFSTTIDIGGRNVSQIFGLMNMSGNFAAAACPVLVGWLFERVENWNLVLLLFAGVYVLGAVFWLLIDPNRRVE